MLEQGRIDASEAATLLEALGEASSGGQFAAEAAPALEDQAPEWGQEQVPPHEAPSESRWARFWIYPVMAGGLVLILGATVMAIVYATDAARGWLVCGWLPMLAGLLVAVLAFWSRRATWLHLRISEGGKRKIAFSFPLPLGLAAWVVRIAQPFVPQLRETGVDDLIIALRESSARGEPFFVEVQDEQDGEKVEVYIG